MSACDGEKISVRVNSREKMESETCKCNCHASCIANFGSPASLACKGLSLRMLQTSFVYRCWLCLLFI